MIPEILDANQQAYHLDILRTISVAQQKNQENGPIPISIQSFARNMETSGALHGLIASELRGDNPEYSNWFDRLRLLGFEGHGHRVLGSIGDVSQFYFDGSESMVLLDPTNSIGVCVGLSLASDPHLTPLTREPVGDHIKNKLIGGDDLIIVQLQGPLEIWKTVRSLRHQATESQLLESIRWELALAELASLYAQQKGKKRIFMLPVDQNVHFPKDNPNLSSVSRAKYQVGKMRYDVTARRLGFRLDPETKLFVKSLVTES